jgi:hypothetical protein
MNATKKGTATAKGKMGLGATRAAQPSIIFKLFVE